MADGNENNNNESKATKALLSVLKFLGGFFWHLVCKVFFDALILLKYGFAFVLIACIAFIVYCFAHGYDFNDFTAGMEMIGNAVEELLEVIQISFPNIQKYLIGVTGAIEIIRVFIDKVREYRASQNSQTHQTGGSGGNASPNHLPAGNSQGTYINVNAFFYTDNYQATQTTAIKNGHEVIDSLKISCDIINDHNRTEKVVFESSVYFPAINMVKYLHSESYKVMPCSTVNANNPLPVNITPALADEIYKEVISKQGYVSREIKCTVRIMTNRKLAYEENINWQKN